MNLTDREKANTLLALRVLQGMPKGAYEGHMSLDGHDIMDADEIDDLCEKLNPPETPSSRVFQICLPGYDDTAGEGKDGVLWVILEDLEEEAVREEIDGFDGECRFGEIVELTQQLAAEGEVPGIDFDCRYHLEHSLLMTRLAAERRRYDHAKRN